MRLNWKELPGLVNFSNENNAKLFFHTLWFPPGLALWNLSSRQLEHIHIYLNRFKWTARSETEKNNINIYRSLLTQIEDWRLNALEHEKQTAY